MAGDLHTHTTLSDGSVRIERLPWLAARAGLHALAISDHDSVRSVQYALEHPEQEGVHLIPATELSARDPATGRKVHLLAYWPRICPALEDHCTRMAAQRNAADRQSAAVLEKLYPQFTTAHALEHARDSGILYKSGIMREMQELGLSRDMYGDVYKSLFSRGGPAHFSVQYDTVDQVLDTMRACRAVIVFAHPSVYRSMPLVRELAAQGRIDGIEIDHPRNTPEDKAECRMLCTQYGLIQTGGTDFHGVNTQDPHPVGTCTTADDQIERIRALACRRQDCAL